MTKDEEAKLRKRASDARAQVRELEAELDNHNPNWRTRLWRGAQNASNLGGIAVAAGPGMKSRKWGPLYANTWIGLTAEALDILVEHPALRTATEFGKGFLGGRVALRRSGQGGV